MSLNESKTDAITKMTRDNYLTWIERVKDYIMALDHDDAVDIWQAFIWEPGDAGDDDEGDEADADPADHDYQSATTAPERKLRIQHNKAFRFIRNSLSPEVFDTTMGLPCSVPKLLRHLRNYWNDGSVIDRDSLRMEYLEMALEK